MTTLSARLDRWLLSAPFTISRRTFTESLVLTVQLQDGPWRAWGECEPHEFDQTAGERELQAAQALAADPPGLAGLDREHLQATMPNRPLRNALDCALWDLQAKKTGLRAWQLAGKDDAPPIRIMPTVGLDLPGRMAQAAARQRQAPAIKIKLGGHDGRDGERIEAVSAAAPGVPLLADINGGWTRRQLMDLLPLAVRCGVSVIEQPLPPGQDVQLPRPPADLRFCADESCTDRASLDLVARHYQMINVKLDKTGGLTEALATVEAAARRGMPYMVGSNGGTSLAMAPLYVLAIDAQLVDLGVEHLLKDRMPGLPVRDGLVHPPPPQLWG